jgi:hypothetical protein
VKSPSATGQHTGRLPIWIVYPPPNPLQQFLLYPISRRRLHPPFELFDNFELGERDLVPAVARPGVTQIASEVGSEFLPALKFRRHWEAAYHCSILPNLPLGKTTLPALAGWCLNQALDAGLNYSLWPTLEDRFRLV